MMVWKKVTLLKIWPFLVSIWLVVEPTPLKKYARQNGFIFPKVRGERSKNI